MIWPFISPYGFDPTHRVMIKSPNGPWSGHIRSQRRTAYTLWVYDFCDKRLIMARVSHAEELHPPLLADTTSTPRATDLDTAVRAAQNGDEAAFRLLYRRIHPRLLRYVTTLVGDDAEDVTSEAWLQIARDLASFTGDTDGFRAWTATIARHRALDHLRHHKRHPAYTHTAELPQQIAPDDTATKALESLSTQAALHLIARLPRDQAEIIMLRVVIGLSAEHVARLLGKRPGAVRTATHRGLRRLQHILTTPEQPR